MRIMSMHKATPDMEAGMLPSAKVMAEMGPFMGELARAGVFLAGEGLLPSARGVRLNFANGKRTITKGPLTGSNELVSAYAIVSTKTIDEAIEWASRTAGPRRPVAAGEIVLTAGVLQPSDRGVRLRFRDGKRTLMDGPFTESKELIAGFSILEVSSIEDAVAIAEHFAAIIGDIEIDIRPMD